jgi:hypothetical protein
MKESRRTMLKVTTFSKEIWNKSVSIHGPALGLATTYLAGLVLFDKNPVYSERARARRETQHEWMRWCRLEVINSLDDVVRYIRACGLGIIPNNKPHPDDLVRERNNPEYGTVLQTLTGEDVYASKGSKRIRLTAFFIWFDCFAWQLRS